MGETDRLSPELRSVEKKLDEAYCSNRLLRVAFSTATWTLLGVFEDWIAGPIFRMEAPNIQRSSHRDNLMINGLKHSLRWLQKCPRIGRFEPRYDHELYQNALDLLNLGPNYDAAETMFIFASRGHCNLALEGTQVVPTPLVDAMDARYYAYNRFQAAGLEPVVTPAIAQSALETVKSVRVTDRGFTVSINPGLVAREMEASKPVMDSRFRLPGEWRTSRYTFADFKVVYSALYALAAIQFRARVFAAAKGAPGLGSDNVVLVYSVGELQARVCRYTGLNGRTVAAILEDLTYGSRGVGRPDPALQPIIPVGKDTLLVARSLILCSSAERNLCTLLNSIPEERQVYATMVDQKEAIMREAILESVGDKEYRCYSGNVRGRTDLPDIDVALIDDHGRKVLLIELKWFIGPDEVREVLNRGDDLRKGVSQVKALLSTFCDGSGSIQETLSVDEGYEFHGVVVSENWIGPNAVQDETVPIVSLKHLTKVLNRMGPLRDVSAWLRERRYLPVEGVHFRVRQGEVRIGEHGVVWWDIEPLITTGYDPFSSDTSVEVEHSEGRR